MLKFEDIFLRAILKYLYLLENSILPVYFDNFKQRRNSDVHTINTRHKDKLHLSHEFSKNYTRQCLKYGLFKIQMFISTGKLNYSNTNEDMVFYINNDKLTKMFQSKSHRIFIPIVEKVHTHSLWGYMKYIKIRFIDTYV